MQGTHLSSECQTEIKHETKENKIQKQKQNKKKN